MFKQPQKLNHTTPSQLAVYLPAVIMILVGMSLFVGMLISALLAS